MDLTQELEQRSDIILLRLIERGGNYPGFEDQAKGLCDLLARAGKEISDPEQRSRLKAKLSYWASEIRTATGQFYSPPRLADYNPKLT